MLFGHSMTRTFVGMSLGWLRWWRRGVSPLLVFLAFSSQSAEPLVGSWHAQLPATTANMAVLQRSVEFATNGSFQMKEVVRIHTNTSTVPLTGTYRIVDTNHLILEIAFAPTLITNKEPFALKYQIQGDELVLEDWASFDPRRTIKYRRVTK